jgi:DHA2 family methylenomycin A resistance protein-like MFS transporter
MVSVALPTIGKSLHASATDLQWIVDAYVLVYASLLVAGGVIGDRRGRKGTFMLGLSLFGAGSLITGLAPSVGVLLTGRVLQGLGPALLIPGSLTIIRATFEEPRRRALAIGLWSMASGLSLAIGPSLGGLIVSGLGWRWVFVINVPLAVILLALAAHFVPRLSPSPAHRRFDWLGAILTTTAIAALAYGIIHGQVAGLTSPSALGAFAAGIAALIAFVAWERHRPEPLVDVFLFSRPAFTAANVAALIVFFAFVGAIVDFSQYFQLVQGHSPIAAGLDVSAIGVAFAIASPLSGRAVGRVGPLAPMLAGLVLAGGATLGLLRLGPHTPVGSIWWNFALLGAGIGTCLTPMTQTALSAVDASHAGMASAVHNSLRQVGQVFGVAVLGLLVYAHLPSGTSAGGRLGPAHGALFVDGLHTALWVSGLALLGAAVLVALLFSRQRSKGTEAPKTQPRASKRPAAPPPATRRPATPVGDARRPSAVPNAEAIRSQDHPQLDVVVSASGAPEMRLLVIHTCGPKVARATGWAGPTACPRRFGRARPSWRLSP